MYLWSYFLRKRKYRLISASLQYAMNIGQRILWCNSWFKHLNVYVCYNNNALAQLNNCIEGLLHLGPNVITFKTLFHSGQLLHLGLQQQ